MQASGTIDGQQIMLGVLASGEKQATFAGKIDAGTVRGEWTSETVKDDGIWFGTLTPTATKQD